ncbi:MAG: hypothetical protein ACE5IO_10250, partial [Thermoplasmata archaeon]
LALDWVMRLVQVLKGRVVITSDHGNLFGEYGLFRHPRGLYLPELTQVPWLELQGGEKNPAELLNVIEEEDE